MSTKLFTEKMVNELNNNPYVISATTKRIEYTEEFKEHFVEQYRLGKGPRDIFKEAGFDVTALGNKRIERASDRWRQAYNEGKLIDQSDYVHVHERRASHRETMRETIARQQGEINKLESELTELRAKLTALRD